MVSDYIRLSVVNYVLLFDCFIFCNKVHNSGDEGARVDGPAACVCVLQQSQLSAVNSKLSALNSSLSERVNNVTKMQGPPVCNYTMDQHYQIDCYTELDKKHLKNVGPIRHCEPPHAHLPGVASGTVACRLCIDVQENDNDDNDNDNDNDNA